MGDAEAGIWYMMTLALGSEGRSSRGDDWNPPLELNGWLSQADSSESMAGGKKPRVVTPAVDVRIGNEGILLVAEMPGVPRERIDIRVGPRYVEIIGKPPQDGGPDGRGNGDRPDRDAAIGPMAAVEAARVDVQAQLRDGVLELRLPRNVLLSGNANGRIPVL